MSLTSIFDNDFVAFLIDTFLAFVLGSIIGIERQLNQKVAGLKTNTLVCLGSSLFVSLSDLTVGAADHTRIASQIVSGIGFIGAGVMFKEGVNVKGLNTAATLWCAGAIGTLVGSGFHKEAVVGTIVVVSTHLMFRPLSRYLSKSTLVDIKEDEHYYTLHVVTTKSDMPAIKAIFISEIMREGIVLNALETTKEDKKREIIAHIIGKTNITSLLDKIINRISIEEAVNKAHWRLERKDSGE